MRSTRGLVLVLSDKGTFHIAPSRIDVALEIGWIRKIQLQSCLEIAAAFHDFSHGCRFLLFERERVPQGKRLIKEQVASWTLTPFWPIVDEVRLCTR